MKRLITFLLASAMLVMLFLPAAFAASPRLDDGENMLTESQKSSILARLDSVSKAQGMDVVIVTKFSTEGHSLAQYADDYYDYNGYAEDGILLLVTYNDYYISTSGKCVNALKNSSLDKILDDLLPYMKKGDYAGAFNKFITFSETLFININSGKSMVEPLPFSAFLICLAVGLIIALIAVSVMRGKLKTVRFKANADSYVVKNSFNLRESRDMFLYSHVSRRLRPKDNGGGSGSHTSSSGRTHGGGGRSYR